MRRLILARMNDWRIIVGDEGDNPANRVLGPHLLHFL
jgi:hypothetical protein